MWHDYLLHIVSDDRRRAAEAVLVKRVDGPLECTGARRRPSGAKLAVDQNPVRSSIRRLVNHKRLLPLAHNLLHLPFLQPLEHDHQPRRFRLGLGEQRPELPSVGVEVRDGLLGVGEGVELVDDGEGVVDAEPVREDQAADLSLELGGAVAGLGGRLAEYVDGGLGAGGGGQAADGGGDGY